MAKKSYSNNTDIDITNSTFASFEVLEVKAVIEVKAISKDLMMESCNVSIRI
jgi:hypothetical protein